MTYFLKDCNRKVSPPAKGREDIARAVAETFATRPYIRFAVLIEPYADGSGDDSVELITVPDRRFGVPLLALGHLLVGLNSIRAGIPWAATGCEEFAYDLVAALGRDVDCCLDKCERARLALVRRTFTPIYRRPDSAIEPANRYLASARADAAIASSALRCHRMNADHVARHAARTVGQCLLAATSAFGGKDDPTATLPDILDGAIGCGVLYRRGWMGQAAERLEAQLSAAECGADIGEGDALEAACLANRFADKLLADGRPAFHIVAQRLH